MITFRYLTEWGECTSEKGMLSFVNSIRDLLSYGARISRFNSKVTADFGATIHVTGQPLDTLPALAKEFQLNQQLLPLPLPSKNDLQAWNQLIFDLYARNSTMRFLRLGHIEGAGVYHPEGRLYGGHLLVSRDCIELNVSLTTVDVLVELEEDISLGLQSLLAITSNDDGLTDNLVNWMLTLRPGMLYEEIYNGRDS